MEDNYSVDIGEGRWFQNDASAFHLLCTLFLLIYQLHLTLDQALDPGAWGPLLYGKVTQKRADICVGITDSLYCTPETNTTL